MKSQKDILIASTYCLYVEFNADFSNFDEKIDCFGIQKFSRFLIKGISEQYIF